MATDRFTRGWDGDRHKGTRLGTLWADCDSGEGDVTLRLNGMCDNNAWFRLVVLQNWISLLQKEFYITHQEWHREIRRIAKKKAAEKALNP